VTDQRDTDRIPALVFGRGVTLLGVLRALGSARVPTQVGADSGDFTRWSRWYHDLEGEPCRSSDARALTADLERLDLPRAVLFACNDSAALAIAGLEGAIAERFPASIASVEAQRTCADKLAFADTLERLGVSHPPTRRIDQASDLEALPVEAFDDVFLKPRDSQRFSAFYGVKAFRCRGRDDAISNSRRALQDGHPLVLQAYIGGPPTAHHFIDGFVDRHGEIRALFARQRLRMEPLDFGNSSYMISESLDEVPQAIESLRTLFADIGYRGIFSAEFKRDPRDGVLKILEVNARPWWYVGFAYDCGVDVCRLAYLDALGEPVPIIARYRVGKTCVYPPLDLKAYLRGRREDSVRLGSMARQWFGAAQPVFKWSDPGPGIREFFALSGSVTRRALGGGKR
jgi:D-aspartate ligase